MTDPKLPKLPQLWSALKFFLPSRPTSESAPRLILGVITWTASLLVAFTLVWTFMPAPKVLAAVTNSGVLFFGDQSATNAGTVRARTFTSPSTFGTQFNTATASTTSWANWIVAKAAPTRDEMMIGVEHANGAFDLQTCTTGCDATADYTLRWSDSTMTSTQTCNATTAGGCIQPFDIGYMALSGKAMVAYTNNVNSKFYYAIWDGSSWSPNSTPGSPTTTNQIDTSSCATGAVKFIRVIPAGDNLADDRSDRMMVMADISNSLCAWYWDGSSFDSGTLLSSTLGLSGKGRPWDGNWQGVNTFVASYNNSAVVETDYNVYTVGTGWGTSATAYTGSTTPIWIQSSADPTSSRIFVTSSATGADTRSAVWRGDDATDGWTVCTTPSSQCPDTTTETVGGEQAYGAFERFNGDALHLYNNAGTTADSSYFGYTAPSSWTNTTRTTVTTSDDAIKVKAWGSPNSAQIMTVTEDLTCKAYADMWTGSAFSTAVQFNSTALASESQNACPASGTPGASPIAEAFDFDFAWKTYSPWQRNWEFYSGSDTASVPTSGLAAQNTTPTGFDATSGQFRLRVNYAEKGTLSQTDARKKLQYTSGCNPNTSLAVSCTWTDVDNVGGSGIWRYFDPTCTPTDCADNTVLTGTTLTGSSTCSAGNGCGTWIISNNGATVTNMDQNGSTTQEGEWDVQANGAAASTTYYFRLWDTDQLTPVYTWAAASDCGSAGTAACTYPSITTGGGAAGPTTDQLMYNGDYFSGGSEQNLFWAN